MNQDFLYLMLDPPPTRWNWNCMAIGQNDLLHNLSNGFVGPQLIVFHILIPASPGGNFQKQCKYKD